MTQSISASSQASESDSNDPVVEGSFQQYEDKDQLVAALRQVYDPEIPVNLYDLGLIYRIDMNKADNGYDIYVEMTLTSPGCPVAGEMPRMVKDALSTVSNIGDVQVELVWEPPWTKDRMSEIARLELGFF